MMMEHSNLTLFDRFRCWINPSNEEVLQENRSLQNQVEQLNVRCDRLAQDCHFQKNFIDYNQRRINGISWTLPVSTPFDPHHHLSFLSHGGIIIGLLVAAVAIPLFALGMSGRKVLPLGKLSLACSTSNSLFFLLSGLGITGSMIGLKNNLDAARKQKHLNHYEKALREKEAAFQRDSGFKNIYPQCKALYNEAEQNKSLVASLRALSLYQIEENLENGLLSLQDAHEQAAAPADVTTRLQLVTWIRQERHLLTAAPGKLARFWLAIHKPVLHMVSIGAVVAGIALVAFGSLLIAAHWKGKTSLQFLKWTVLVEQQDAIGYCIKGVSLILTAAGLELYVRGNDEAYLRKNKTVTKLADTLELTLEYYKPVTDKDLKNLISSQETYSDDDEDDDLSEKDATVQTILQSIHRNRQQLEGHNAILYTALGNPHQLPVQED